VRRTIRRLRMYLLFYSPVKCVESHITDLIVDSVISGILEKERNELRDMF